MNPSELFDIWAPPASAWSKWAKPILFAEFSAVVPADVDVDPLPHLVLRADSNTALVVDLPSADSVKAGLASMEVGYRPVPLFNGNRGPLGVNIGTTSIVDNEPILAWLLTGASLLAQQDLPWDAPPAFLLDSRRQVQVTASPGRFDNRWMVFPQDFPSANFLRSKGISQAVLLQEDILRQPREDLAHVLRRWQEAGLSLFVTNLVRTDAPQPLSVGRPSRFRALWYVALAAMGLRRNSAGGFGSIVPQPSSGAG